MRNRFYSCLAIAFLAGALTAQQNIVWLNDSNAGTGGSNAFPFGHEGIRYQTIVDGTLLPPVAVLNDIFVAGGPNAGDMEVHYTDIEIRIGRTALLFPTQVWATNNPNPTVVYRGPLRVNFVSRAWTGIGLPNPYVILNNPAEPNLCIEIIVWGAEQGPGTFYYAESDATVRRLFLANWTTSQPPGGSTGTGGTKMGLLLDDGNFVEVGSGCPGTTSTPRIGTSTWPQAGAPVNITLTGVAPASASFLSLGTSFRTFGGLPLPLDLGILGAPGCRLWNDSLVMIPTVANATGTASIAVPIPFGSSFTRIYCHWLNLDVGANAFGLTTSSGGKLILGL